MSNEADHVQVNVTLQPGGSVLPGFGGALILSHTAAWDELTRTYTSVSGLAEDWATTSPEYRAGSKMLSQNPRPPRIQVGRMTAAVILKYAMRAAVPVAGKVHLVKVKGDGFEDTTISYTAGVSPTRAQVNNAIVNALNAVTDKNYTAAFAPLVVADTPFVAEADTETFTSATALVFADRTFTAAASDIVTVAAHGLSTGAGPFRLTTTAADLPLNLLIATDYWVSVIDANTFYFAATLADALAGVPFDIADAGSGVHTMADTAETRSVTAHGLLSGDGPIQVSNAGGALPAGLVAVTDYYVVRVTANTFKLATTRALAVAGTADVAISTDGTGVQTLADVAGTLSPDLAFTVTGSANAEWFSIEAVDPKLFYLAMTHTVSGIADDLTAIIEEDATPYCLLVLYPSTDYVLEAAAWCEANDRVMVIDVPETDALNVAVSIGTDTLKQLFDLGYKNTMFAFHHAPDEFMSAAWMGRWLPTTPGKSTPKWKNLAGVTVSRINPTQRANLIARRGNAYQTVGSTGSTWEGTVASTVNKFFDNTRNLHWLTATIQNKGVDLFQGNEIIPYTPEGIQDCGGVVEASFELAIQNGVGARVPAPVVTLPTIESINALLPEDKANRVLRNVLGTLSLAGAVHGMIVDVNVSF